MLKALPHRITQDAWSSGNAPYFHMPDNIVIRKLQEYLFLQAAVIEEQLVSG